MSRRRRLAYLIGIALVALIVLLIWKPWRPSPEAFREEDRNGYIACQEFEKADGAGGSVYHDHIGRAAMYGAVANTQGIRATVDARNGGREGVPVVRGLSDMRNACKAAGYRFR